MPKKLEYYILEEMQEANMPIGASYLSLRLTQSQATIGRMLQELEHSGHIAKVSNKGRILTEAGKQYYNKLKNENHFNEFTHSLVKVINTSNEQIYADILYIRLLLEPPAVRLATQKITAGQIDYLKTILDKQADKQKKGELGEEENLEFHTKIARYSGNKVLEQLLKIILLQNNSYMPFSYIQYQISLQKHEHIEILQAMANGNADKAGQLMHCHIMDLASELFNSERPFPSIKGDGAESL